MKKTNIVIIGAGFGGLSAVVKLSKLGISGGISLTIIDKRGIYFFTPDYYRIIGNYSRAPINISSSKELRSGVAFPLRDIFKNCEKVNVVIDEAISVDSDMRKVKTKNGKDISFDHLIIATGSETNFFQNPNIEKNAIGLKNIEDAFNIRNAVEELFSKRAKHDSIRIAIGGGGFVGCELAAALAGLIGHLSRAYGHPVKNTEIVILEATKTILGGTDAWIQDKAKKRLERLGVKILTGDSLADVSDKEIFLKGGKSIPYDLFIWTAGVKINPLEGIDGENFKEGHIKVDDYLRIRPFQNIFAIGDVIFKINPRKKRPIPMIGWVAAEQGEYVAQTIARLINKKNMRPYVYSGDKFIIPLGGKYALADLGWLKTAGFVAWLLKHLANLRYFMKIFSFPRALSLVIGKKS